jgi:hypothetical protein
VDHRTELAVVEFEGERRILFYFDGRPRIAIGPDVGHPIVTFFDEAGTLQHTVASLDGRTMLLGTNDSQVSVTPDGEVIEKKGQG